MKATPSDAANLDIFGFDKTENAIFLGLETAKSIQELHKITSISRSGIVYALEKLEKRDLVQKVNYGKRFLYLAIPKDKLASKLYLTADILNSTGKNKKSVKVRATIQSDFAIHVGMEELVVAHERIVSLHKNQRLYAIQPNKSWQTLQRKMSKDQFVRFNEILRSNGLIIEAILADNAYALYKSYVQDDPEKLKEMASSLGNRMADYTLVGSGYFNHGAELWIYENNVFIINWEDEVGIEITNKDVTNLIKDMFDFIKAYGKKVDHNQMMRDIVESFKK